jgi:hypothetical protein
MELNDIIFLGACAIYAGMPEREKDQSRSYNVAISEAKKIWEEVLKQDK